MRRGQDHVDLVIEKRHRPGLKQRDRFSHVIVVWWAHRMDDEDSRSNLTCETPCAEGHLTGVFECRSECRPEPIAVSPAKVLGVDDGEGVVSVNGVDVLEGSPILDLKAHFPVIDRVKDAHMADHLVGWPGWLPEDGLGLEH